MQKVRKRLLMVFLVFSFAPLTSFIPFYYPPFGIKKVVIDAGHGGKDTGCLGSSAKEKDIALSVSLKFGKFIEKNFKDVEVIYTRTTDKFLELHERADIANVNDADLFVCIHANSGPSAASGTETYIMGLHRTKSNLEVAKRENSAILLEDNYQTHYEGFDPNSDESYIALSLMQSVHFEQSLRFADKVQKQFKKVGRKDRGVKQAGFLVLYRTTMPSVLIETGFLTNKSEEEYLISDKNQEIMASAIFDAFKEYKQEMDSKVITEGPVKDPNGVGENDDHGLVFKVQIASSVRKVELVPGNFDGLTGLSEYEVDGMYKYMVGSENSLEEASRLQRDLRTKGFSGAFVVAFYNGEKIDIDKAVDIQKSQN